MCSPIGIGMRIAEVSRHTVAQGGKVILTLCYTLKPCSFFRAPVIPGPESIGCLEALSPKP